ncbi:hypothetical protein HBB16_11080 [Pseudonocardia sp. MCCB 268]|nr:hypothetical protein [Pseudonocardia cytotoxica]
MDETNDRDHDGRRRRWTGPRAVRSRSTPRRELGLVHAVETVGWLVAGGVPVLVLIAGFFTYLFAGSALRPVEQMRAPSRHDRQGPLQRVLEPAVRDEVGRSARTMNQDARQARVVPGHPASVRRRRQPRAA